MAQWIDALAVIDLPAGSHRVVELEDVSLLVVNIEGEFHAIENLCSHDGGDLSDGEVIGSQIICPRHGARFCLKTGAVLCAPAFEDVDSYPVRVVGDRIEVCSEP